MMFQKARDNAFMEFMNEQGYSPTYMAQFTDHQMRTGLKGKSDEDVEACLVAIIRLFCCLHARDFYLKEYEKELAQRLLNKSSLSNEYEEKMIQKLKIECGANQVSKMTQMMKDISVGARTTESFAVSNQMPIDLKIEILTAGTWPQMNEAICVLPLEMK